ncbi:MAG: peptidyl-alpha-hydroxyglycine alpha-amidating lyase family protein [Gammaproteobacteria bacterium]|nr:6-bladed beta-propeller [Pseudomonadales bacterium]MCP5349087.1 6-bladed beta-propeller [Pseudomonadales bacterium]
MTRFLAAVFLSLSCSSAAWAQYAPQIEFEAQADFFAIPAGMNFGEVSAIAVNSENHVFVFHRASPSGGGPAYGISAARLWEFDATGHYLREHGSGLYAWAFAHGLRIDAKDDIWTVDKGSNMIVRMNPEGRVVWVFGRKTESVSEAARPFEHVDTPRPAEDGRFREPTDVAFDSEGNIYISDGYINSRVAKYDANGDWVKSWGEPGRGPGQFRLPHSIVIDSDDNIYVGDRSNSRIQVFDTEGNYLREFSVATPIRPGSKAVNGPTPADLDNVAANGAPNALCIPPGSNIIFVGETTFPGRIIKATLQGEVLGTIGNSGRNPGEFSGAHGLACPSENLLYVAETSNSRAQRLVLK